MSNERAIPQDAEALKLATWSGPALVALTAVLIRDPGAQLCWDPTFDIASWGGGGSGRTQA